MKRPHVVMATLLVLSLPACGGPGKPPPNQTPTPAPAPTPSPSPSPSTTPNNSAVIFGTTLGGGTPNSLLSKDISASLSANNANLRLGSAYATRDSADSETLYWFVAVVNQSRNLQCFVEASGLRFENSAGQTLFSDDFTFVSGSVGVKPPSDRYTDTCLESGQMGYLFGIELEEEVPLLYSSISSIAISTLSSITGFDVPAARIIPQRYSPDFSVEIRNEGTGAARVGDFSHYFLLDENSLPLSWGYFDSSLDTLDDNPVIEAGGTHTLSEPFSIYNGSTNRVQVQVDFTSPADSLAFGSAFLSKAVNSDRTKKQYLEWRSSLEQANRNASEGLKHNR